MVESIIRGLDSQLVCTGYHVKDTQVIFYISSGRKEAECPFCGEASSKVHSHYQREIQDLPIQDRQAILLLDVRKMLCQNPECSHTAFAERFGFVGDKGKKTRRLAEKILVASAKVSSVSASKILAKDAVRVSKSSICDMLKKNTSHCGQGPCHKGLHR